MMELQKINVSQFNDAISELNRTGIMGKHKLEPVEEGDTKELRKRIREFTHDVEQLDTKGKAQLMPKSVADFYNMLYEDEAEAPEPEEFDKDETPTTTPDPKEDEGGEMSEEVTREMLEAMTLKEVKMFIIENELDIAVKGKDQEDLIDEVMALYPEEEKDADSLEAMTLKDLKMYVVENDLDISVKGKTKEELIEAAIADLETDIRCAEKNGLHEYAEKCKTELEAKKLKLKGEQS